MEDNNKFAHCNTCSGKKFMLMLTSGQMFINKRGNVTSFEKFRLPDAYLDLPK